MTPTQNDCAITMQGHAPARNAQGPQHGVFAERRHRGRIQRLAGHHRPDQQAQRRRVAQGDAGLGLGQPVPLANGTRTSTS